MTQQIKLLGADSIHFFKNDPKRRSYLDIQRMADSIVKNGFICPILYWLEPETSKNYIVDGRCRVIALQQLWQQNITIPSLPFGVSDGYIPAIRLVVEKEQLKEIVIASHGSYSIMTEKTLRSFIGETSIDLHHYAFAEGQLIDFYEENLDVTAYFTDVKRVAKSNEKLGSLLV